MNRITLTDDITTILVKMAEGNPGALSAMTAILKEHEGIDPQAAAGGWGAIFALDACGIYGTDIYVLWNNKCNCNVRDMLMLMRATQLGFFPEERLQEMAHDPREINLSKDEWAELDDKVCDRLEDFKRTSRKAGRECTFTQQTN